MMARLRTKAVFFNCALLCAIPTAGAASQANPKLDWVGRA
jgi:hypothetical protein